MLSALGLGPGVRGLWAQHPDPVDVAVGVDWMHQTMIAGLVRRSGSLGQIRSLWDLVYIPILGNPFDFGKNSVTISTLERLT